MVATSVGWLALFIGCTPYVLKTAANDNLIFKAFHAHLPKAHLFLVFSVGKKYVRCRSYLFTQHIKLFTLFSQQAVDTFMPTFIMGAPYSLRY
jgi:hypothetical protein